MVRDTRRAHGGTMHTHHDPPSVVETRLVHEMHRRATSLLADALAQPPGSDDAVSQLRDLVVATLHHHHRGEDADLWPQLLDAAPELEGPLRSLSVEHQQLDVALDVLREVPIGDIPHHQAAELAVAVRNLVHEHLAHEEPVLLPALRAHVPDEDWDEFSARMVATSPPVGTDLLVALLHAVGSDSEVEVIFHHLPRSERELLPSLRAQGEAVLAQLGTTAHAGRSS